MNISLPGHLWPKSQLCECYRTVKRPLSGSKLHFKPKRCEGGLLHMRIKSLLLYIIRTQTEWFSANNLMENVYLSMKSSVNVTSSCQDIIHFPFSILHMPRSSWWRQWEQWLFSTSEKPGLWVFHISKEWQMLLLFLLDKVCNSLSLIPSVCLSLRNAVLSAASSLVSIQSQVSIILSPPSPCSVWFELILCLSLLDGFVNSLL